ncbi:MAG: DUF3459 domain-containing protein [Chthoniobacter sp.]
MNSENLWPKDGGADLQKFPIFERELAERDFPSPQARATFEQSKLHWEEAELAGHGGCLRLYREALRLRREHPVFRPRDRAHTEVAELSCEVLAIRARSESEDWLLLCDLRGGHHSDLNEEPFCALEESRQWHLVFSSNATEFGGADPGSYDAVTGRLAFEHPEVLVLRAE